MAIVEMKRMTLLAPQADQERLLRALQKMRCVEISQPDPDAQAQSPDASALSAVREQLRRVDWALGQLKRYDTAGKPMFGAYPQVTPEDTDAVWKEQARYMLLVDTLEDFERRRGEMKAQELRAQNLIAQYTPWQEMTEAPSQALKATGHVRFFAGTLPARDVPKLEEKLRELQYAAVSPAGSDRENACLIVAAHQETAQQVQAVLDEMGFAQETFSPLGNQTPREFLAQLHEQLEDIQWDRDQMQDAASRMAGDIRGLKILHELLADQLQRQEAAQRFTRTESTFLFRGWVPAEAADKVCAKIRKISPACALDIAEPGEDETPPTQLRNGTFASAFEPVVEGFSLPDYRGIDPTAVMAPFYACLFGMMVSDAGYGLLMALLIPIFIKVKKIKRENAKMLDLLTWGGIATVIWGLIYNTVFGFNPLPEKYWLLDAVNNSLPVMGVCIGVGALHLFAGLGVGAYLNFRRGQPLAAVADQIAWGTLIIGLGLLLLEQTKQLGLVLALASAAVILLFTKRGEKNPLKRILGGLGALYGITGWVSDLLSYMRLFGMGLATGVIGMVFNQLIGMVWGAGILGKAIGAVLFVACHLFNLGINALGAYVHACRLQYIEFFGKFYEDGGRPFRPLASHPKYVSVQPAQTED